MGSFLETKIDPSFLYNPKAYYIIIPIMLLRLFTSIFWENCAVCQHDTVTSVFIMLS